MIRVPKLPLRWASRGSFGGHLNSVYIPYDVWQDSQQGRKPRPDGKTHLDRDAYEPLCAQSVSTKSGCHELSNRSTPSRASLQAAQEERKKAPTLHYEIWWSRTCSLYYSTRRKVSYLALHKVYSCALHLVAASSPIRTA